MTPYLRLRQVCLAAPHLDAASGLVQALLGVEECHRDPNLAKYGLENALFVIGADRFLEIVSPIERDTAAGRFMDRSKGHGGYMLIFDCDDPKPRIARAAAMGVRLANHIDHPQFQGYQLHPKDCRATFLEFDHTLGGEDAAGAYWPAGPDWQKHLRMDVTQRLAGVEVVSSDPVGLARHWSGIMDVPHEAQPDGSFQLTIDRQVIAIAPAPPVAAERLDAIVLAVRGAADILSRARLTGLAMREDGFLLCGVWFRLFED